MIAKLFLGWQDSVSRRWFAIGTLTYEKGVYQFGYLQGALNAQREAGFQPLLSFPQFDYLYESRSLFPFFSTRIMSASRPDYADYLEWLGLNANNADPWQILSRSEALHATDHFRVFSGPQAMGDSSAQVVFPVHGLRHASESSKTRALLLSPGEHLLLLRDVQNPRDASALAFRTAETDRGDMYLMGYCPRYYAMELGAALSAGARVVVTVDRVNPEPAPWNLRVIACANVMGFTGDWMSSTEYRMLASPVPA